MTLACTPYDSDNQALLTRPESNSQAGLAPLLLTVVELVRQLLEAQIIRRMEKGVLSESDLDRAAESIQKLQEQMVAAGPASLIIAMITAAVIGMIFTIQVALQQSDYCAWNIWASFHDKPALPFRYQPLGWFKNRIESIKDLDKMRFRAVGLAAEVFKELGLTTTALQPADIVPWLDKGLIDAAEFNNPSSDRALGFPSVASVCMIRSFHQSSEVFEVIFNKQRFDSLPFALRSIIRYALQASSADLSWKASDRFSTDYEEMRRKQGVRYYVTPDDILKAQLTAWRKIIARESANSRIFKRIIDSQMRFAKRVVGFENDLTPSSKMAFDFWFSTV